MKPLIFDIETKPRPEEELRPLCPEVDPAEFVVGEFDPATVKTGNLKDQAKITEKIAKARAAHEKSASESEANFEQAKVDNWESFLAGSTLDASLSEVCCIGFYSAEKDKFGLAAPDDKITEATVLEFFWGRCMKAIHKQRKIVGVNIAEFDLPYLLRRSYIRGVDVPNVILKNRFGKWPEWNGCFLDIGKAWCGTTHPSRVKWGFQTLSAAFGTAGKFKDGEISGGDFWRFWEQGGEQQELAKKYLEADVRQPAEWCERMGIA